MKKYRNTTSGYGEVVGKSVAYKWPEMAGQFKKIKWLGYKITSIFYDEEYLEDYNNALTTRDINRILIMDEALSAGAIKSYLKLIRETNMNIERNKEETVLAQEVLEKTCEFVKNGIDTYKDALSGVYMLEITAINKEGDVGQIHIPVIVTEDIDNEEDEDEGPNEIEEKKYAEIVSKQIGRVYFSEGEKKIEELAKTESTINSEGFICAGETVAVKLRGKNIEYLEIDINGDGSIKEYDELTKKFLSEEPSERGGHGNIMQEEEYNLPQKIYPADNEDIIKEYVFLYTIPYNTKQTLESWSSLREKSGSFEINKNDLFQRKEDPYEFLIYINGDKEKMIDIPFDIFERWDTVLNRDASGYVNNFNSKWKETL